jgi:folate-dependent phosphoribosylglycinamide formyltransferase PurN
MVVEPFSDIIMLAGENITSWIVYNRLVQEFGPFPILVESTTPRRVLIRNRLRKLGLRRTLSQIAFISLVRPFLEWESRRQRTVICQSKGLETVRPAGQHIIAIDSVNSPDCRERLRQLKPRIVIVNGTRIIKPEVLGATSATFLNIHQGITPQYRGAHGAYWALYQDDRANCGVTTHVVDEGIDTGGIVHQARIDPEPEDNYMSYPLLQTAAALDGLVKAVKDGLAGRLQVKPVEGPSAVWYHPGLFQYVAGRLRGVR